MPSVTFVSFMPSKESTTIAKPIIPIRVVTVKVCVAVISVWQIGRVVARIDVRIIEWVVGGIVRGRRIPPIVKGIRCHILPLAPQIRTSILAGLTGLLTADIFSFSSSIGDLEMDKRHRKEVDRGENFDFYPFL